MLLSWIAAPLVAGLAAVLFFSNGYASNGYASAEQAWARHHGPAAAARSKLLRAKAEKRTLREAKKLDDRAAALILVSILRSEVTP